jgi:hypothetical protein
MKKIITILLLGLIAVIVPAIITLSWLYASTFIQIITQFPTP